MPELKTKLTREQLSTNAQALGFDHTDDAALLCAAMVSDPALREQVTRFYFERALQAVQHQ